MRNSRWTPSIVPGGHDDTVYMVMEHLGQLGTIWPEAEVEKFDLETVVLDLLDGQYTNPIGVIAFNTAVGRCSPRNSAPLRTSDARRSIFSSGFRRRPRKRALMLCFDSRLTNAEL